MWKEKNQMKNSLLILLLFISLSFYGQNDTLSVVRHTDHDFVTAKKLKVIYKGLPNEIFIDVPNVKSFKVLGNGVTKKNQNIYYLNASIGSESILTIDIVLKNNKKISEKQVFKIRELSKLLVTLNHQEGTIFKLQKDKLKDAILRLKFADGNVTTDFLLITDFKIKIPNRKPLEIMGYNLDEKSFNVINKYVSSGDQITIYDVKVLIRCGTSSLKVEPITITII